MTRHSTGLDAALIDVHSHYAGVGSLRSRDGDVSGPWPRADAGRRGHLVTTTSRRPVPDALWDVAARLRQLDRTGVSHQVISPLPALVEHAWTAAPSYARRANDAMADGVNQANGRLFGLGCVAADDIEGELDRLLALGLRGLEIGTTMGGLDLDDPQLDGLWTACEARGASVLVHPVAHGRGVLRRSTAHLDTGLGMVTDTALGAYALVFGGVLERHPQLRVAMAHGCGSFPWTYPRLRHLSGPERPAEDSDALLRRLYADSLVFDVEHVRLLVHRFGGDHLILGTDAPFLPGQLAAVRSFVQEAVASGALDESDAQRVRYRNALTFLGLPPDALDVSGSDTLTPDLDRPRPTQGAPWTPRLREYTPSSPTGSRTTAQPGPARRTSSATGTTPRRSPSPSSGWT